VQRLSRARHWRLAVVSFLWMIMMPEWGLPGTTVATEERTALVIAAQWSPDLLRAGVIRPSLPFQPSSLTPGISRAGFVARRLHARV
jgi:hypothetical protein